MNVQDKARFQRTIWEYYHQQGRHDLPWRLPEPDGSFDPYKILVSEIMLQQTQVTRVLPKYHEFLNRFPTIEVLAEARLSDILSTWSGLGYNRRAQFLWRAARAIVQDHRGVFPNTLEQLVDLPGVGTNTAGAILAYAFNQPVVFVETNIRTVFIHRFCNGQEKVDDAFIAALVAETTDIQKAREWFWALMDYGSFLKQTAGNASRASKTYAKQSSFAGSVRQLRGAIVRVLLEGPRTAQELQALLTDERTLEVLARLVRDGLVQEEAERFSIA